MSSTDTEKTKSNVETRKFDAEISKVLKLMINSLYTNKDIFLRELISNASDACDKLRYESQKDSALINDSNANPKILIHLDEDQKILSIKDNGIGMTKDELIENLGTIAKSGTQKFLDHLTGDSQKDVQLIGQFGVGFYSAFMVAEKVMVKSKKAGTDQSNIWLSEGEGEFTITSTEEDIPTGTEILVYLKDDEAEFLDKFRIKHIIATYSDHISIPIELEDKDGNQTINSASAIWTKSKSEITEDQYKEFYKKISSSPDTPWMTLHNKNEGVVEYTNLLYIPSSRTFDLFHPDRKRSIKLYIKRVFINDEGLDIIPQHLRFLRGVVDSEDLPLNISRETLQHNRVLEKIKNSIVKRVLSELTKRLKNDREDYVKFWENFGSALKEGLCEPMSSKNDILDICLFKSLKHNKSITLAEYVDSMQEGQDEIFYLTGDSEERIKNHPQLDGFIKKEIDVLLLTDTVDDFWLNVVNDFNDKKLTSITRSDIDLDAIGKGSDEDSDTNKNSNDKLDDKDKESLVAYFKEVLGSLVQDVKISKKLTSSPSCLVVGAGAMDIRMEKFLREQKQLHSSSAKILEINTDHAIVKSILTDIKNDSKTLQTGDLVKILFDQACIIEGEPVSNSAEFISRINNLISRK